MTTKITLPLMADQREVLEDLKMFAQIYGACRVDGETITSFPEIYAWGWLIAKWPKAPHPQILGVMREIEYEFELAGRETIDRVFCDSVDRYLTLCESLFAAHGVADPAKVGEANPALDSWQHQACQRWGQMSLRDRGRLSAIGLAPTSVPVPSVVGFTGRFKQLVLYQQTAGFGTLPTRKEDQSLNSWHRSALHRWRKNQLSSASRAQFVRLGIGPSGPEPLGNPYEQVAA